MVCGPGPVLCETSRARWGALRAFHDRNRCSHRRDRYYSDYFIRPIQARPPRSRGAAACDAAASAASCSGLGLCGFLRDGVDSAGFCDLYYGLKEDYSGGDAAGERWRSEHAK